MKFSVSLFCLIALSGLLQGCSGNEESEYQGYVEGEYVYLSSARAGRLEKLLTRKGSSVESGVLLASLESEYERQAVAKSERSLAQARALYNDMLTGRRPAEVSMAKARLAKAKADQANASAELARVEALYRQNAVSRKELDNQRAVSRSADATVVEMQKQVDVYNLPEREQRIVAQKAAVEADEAALAQARWELCQKEIRPPRAGLVYDTLYRVGEWVPAGSPVIQLLPPGNVKIRFFIPEKHTAALHIGDTVTVSMDGESPVSAKVTYIAQNAEYTPPVIYSNETRSKLCFMAEAETDERTAAGLHPGQPVSVVLR